MNAGKKSGDSFRDLVVIGGGPAGSTLAALVKKYHPSRQVMLVEKIVFPRHHVGESLLPEIVPVLKELGVFDKIDGAGFPKKLGASYVWGKNRIPWDADFGDVSRLLKDGASSAYAWQVQRSRYDQILLEHAREMGVEVLEGWTASGIHESRGRVDGVVLRGPEAQPREFSCDFLADCSGQGAFMSRFRSFRRYNDKLKNIAGYAYFRGVPWKYQYVGHPDKTRIFICSVEHGWFWYIPVAPDLVSVGFVTTQEHFRGRGGDFRTLFRESLHRCEELWPTLKAAEWVKDVEGTGQDFFVLNDWSYVNDVSAGDGWIAAGDAAVFVDPILSSGVTLAHLSAHRAAYTLGSCWMESDADARRAMFEDYSEFYREAAASFLAMAVYWYDSDRRAEGWWARAREAVNLPFITDKEAFIMVSAGFASFYDKIHTVRTLLLDGTAGDSPFLKKALGGGGNSESLARRRIEDHLVPKILHPFKITPSFLPVLGTGRLKPVRKICFNKTGGDPAAEALNPRRLLAGPQESIIEAMDGRRSVGEIRRLVAERAGLSPGAAGEITVRFLRDLALSQVVELPFTGEMLS